MKRNKSLTEIDRDVDLLLGVLGLDKVADNAIGTPFIRGLSGGQKKRVDIGAELIASPLVLFLDEPTSGLDSSIAFEVLDSIRKIVKSSNGRLSVMLSIHQPNSRILDLFDHIMLLGGGAMNFFGTVPQSIEYFTSIEFTPPKEYTPTDYFLQVSDSELAVISTLKETFAVVLFLRS
jgi:ABC-type multidrug transport system ATPase subunit